MTNPKSELLTAIRSIHIFIQTLNFALGPSVTGRTQYKIGRFRIKIIGFKIAHISTTNYNKELIFGQRTLFMMLFQKNLSHPIVLKIHLSVTSHFSTLFGSVSTAEPSCATIHSL